MTMTSEERKQRVEKIERLQMLFGGGVVASLIGGIGYNWWHTKPPIALNPEQLTKKIAEAQKIAAESTIKENKKALEFVTDPNKWMNQKKETLVILGVLSIGIGAFCTLAHFLNKWEKNNEKKKQELYDSDTPYGREYRKLMGINKVDKEERVR